MVFCPVSIQNIGSTSGDLPAPSDQQTAIKPSETAYAVATLPRSGPGHTGTSPPFVKKKPKTGHSSQQNIAKSASGNTLNSHESLETTSLAEYDRTYEKIFDKSSIHSSLSAVNKGGATALRKPEFWVWGQLYYANIISDILPWTARKDDNVMLSWTISYTK